MIALHPGEILREEYMAPPPLALLPPSLLWNCGFPLHEYMRLLTRSRAFLWIRPCGLQNFLKLTLIVGQHTSAV